MNVTGLGSMDQVEVRMLWYSVRPFLCTLLYHNYAGFLLKWQWSKHYNLHQSVIPVFTLNSKNRFIELNKDLT